MRRYAKLLLKDGAAEVSALIKLIDLFVRNQPSYAELAEKSGHDERVRKLLKAGFFGSAELLNLILTMDPAEVQDGTRATILEHALNRLVEHGFLVDNSLMMQQAAFARYMFNRPVLATNWDPVLAENICCGWLFIMDRYRASVPALVVETKEGDEAVATAFLLRVSLRNGGSASLLVTNKHVAGASQISRVKRAEAIGAAYQLHRLITSSKYDLAAIEVNVPVNAYHFTPGQGFVLDEVVTLGYPRVAVACDHRLLAHKGELNGTIVDRYDNNEYQVISCSVAPGNSGGPVIDDAGRVVGVVCQSSIGRYLRISRGETTAGEAANDVGVHHLALPITALTDFLDSEVAVQLAR